MNKSSDGTNTVTFDWRRPVYYLERHGRIETISDSPLALSNGSLDIVAVFEMASIGFPLAGRTLFKFVKRLLPREYLKSHGHGYSKHHSIADPPSTSIRDFLAHNISSLPADTAIELSAGLDSRLLLAICLDAGIKPAFGFTLGASDSHDVKIAREIADHCGIRHLSLDARVDKSRIQQDAIAMVRASGYSINAATYAWLPGTLEPLNHERSTQLSGVGGEIIGGFYYSPLDPVFKQPMMHRLWTTMRLNRRWLNAHQLWERSSLSALWSQLHRDVYAMLNRYDVDWHARIDYFYLTQRVGQWAIPVLQASNQYYNVAAPYLEPEYTNWAFSLPTSQKRGRAAQRDLLTLTSPELACFKSCPQNTAPGMGTTIAKILRRTRNAPRAAPLGTTETASALQELPQVCDMVLSTAESADLRLDLDFVRHILSSPAKYSELLGVLITTAIAWHDLASLSRDKRSTRIENDAFVYN